MKQRNALGNGFWVVFALLPLVLGPGTARAGVITIADFNFNGTESFTSSTPWVPFSGGGGYTIGETTSTTGFTQSIPGGTGAGVGSIQYGYNGGFGSSGPNTINQTLTATLQANATYILTGYIGNNGGNPYNIGTPYVELLAGSTVLANVNESFAPNGDFMSWSISYTAPSSGVPSGNLGIVLGLSGGNSGNQNYGQVNFADIGLTMTFSTTTTLTSSQNPSLIGGTVIFTATVAGSSGTPTGTVTFYDGATALGTATLNSSGVAYFGIGTLPVGANSITAVYSGDSNNGSSTSAVLSQSNTGPNSITIINPGFEADSLPTAGQYTTSGASSWLGSAANSGALHYTSSTGNGMYPLPNANIGLFGGVNIAYMGGTGVNLSQVLSPTLAANTTYVLTGVVGHRNDIPGTQTGFAKLIAGSTTLATINIPDPGLNGIAAWSVAYTAPSSVTSGQALKIVLGDNGTGSGDPQVNFDNIALYSGLGSTTTLSSSANPSANNQPVTFTATVSSTGGTPTSGTVTFMDGTTTLGTANVNGSGVATFSTSTLSIATHSITAAYGGSGSYGGSISSAVSQVVNAFGSAYKLAFGVPPITTTAGSAINPAVTVIVQDQYNNTVTTDSSSVTIASGTTSFTGSTLSVNASSGVATFSAIKPTTAGTANTLTASDGSLTGATSSTFTVNAAAASQLVITSTAVTATAGVASGTITVQRQDQYDNPNTTDATRTVTLSSTSTGGTFTSTPLTIASGSSTGTFTYTDTKAGTPTITAASTSPTTITSATQQETVSPAAANAYIITAATTSLTPAVADALTIYLVDQYGNTVTSFSGDKSLTFSGLTTAQNGTHPTVKDKTGAAVNLGTATTITFTSGISSAGGSLLAYYSETNKTLAATDGSLSTTSTGGAGVSLTIANVSPFADAYTLTRASGLNLIIPVSTLMASNTDANGDTLAFVGTSSTSAQGATVSSSGSYVFYVANSATNGDTFTYTITNGFGLTATGTVTVLVVTPGGVLQGLVYTNGMAIVSCAGIPGLQYDVKVSTNLPTFTFLATVTAPTNGVFTYTNNPAPSNSAYYELMQH